MAFVGWAINPEYQNLGYATEAAAALLEFGFEVLHLSVIHATCDVRNESSWRVMQKLGMKRVGLLRGHRQFKGQTSDALRFELLERDR